MLPLVVRDESIGIVELSSTRQNAFGDRDVELAELLVREAAVTFENARLHRGAAAARLPRPARPGLPTGHASRTASTTRWLGSAGEAEHHAAVLFIDLDHFKHLNDRFGHAKGDRALKVIAERIKSIIRPGDTAGRLGGDEFAILLEDVESVEVVQAVCDRLLDRPGPADRPR